MATTTITTTTILSPTTTNTMNTIKRKSPTTEPTKKTVKKSKTTTTATTDAARNCHHCHQARAEFVFCTLKRTKGKKTERCGKVFWYVTSPLPSTSLLPLSPPPLSVPLVDRFYSDNCLKRHYNTSTAVIQAEGKVKDFTKVLGHDASESYYFKCPVCEQKCSCYQHRKKVQDGEADLQAFAKEAGVPVAEVTGIMNGPATGDQGKVKGPPKKEKEVKPKENKEKDAKPKEKKEKESKPKEPKEKELKEKKPKEKKPAAEKKEKAPKELKPKEKKPAIDPTMMTTIRLPLITGPPKPLIRKPKHVDDPNFEFLAISHPLNIINARL